jgi:hypothetical protein
MEKVYSKFFAASLKESLASKEVEEVVTFYNAEGYYNVFAKAKKEKMLPFVASMMCRIHKDENQWKEHYLFYKGRNTKIVSELDRVYRAMDMAEVKKLFLSENLGALLSSGRDIALFASGDADNCSDYSEKEKIYRVMSSLGYSHEEHMTGKRVGMTSFSNDSEMPDGFHINICWGALYREKQPDLFLIDDIGGWDNMRKYKNTSITLPSTDMLLYICLLHISLHSYNRKPSLRLYEDIYNVTYPGLHNWESVMLWADKQKNVTRTVVSAILSSKLLGVTISDAIEEKYNNKDVKKLVNMVYKDGLKLEPSRIGVLSIELASCDSGPYWGGINLLFPNRKWLCATFGNNLIRAYLSYLRHLF